MQGQAFKIRFLKEAVSQELQFIDVTLQVKHFESHSNLILLSKLNLHKSDLPIFRSTQRYIYIGLNLDTCFVIGYNLSIYLDFQCNFDILYHILIKFKIN